MSKENVTLGGCYHSGFAYCLGYDANGKTELCDKLFTNLDSGSGGGALAELYRYREKFDPDQDVPRFIVRLRPVRILHRDLENPKELEDTPECCTSCEQNDRSDEDELCNDCIETDTCEECYERSSDCTCDEEYDDGLSCCICGGKDCEYECVPYISEHMNAFDRARWNKA